MANSDPDLLLYVQRESEARSVSFDVAHFAPIVTRSVSEGITSSMH